MRSSSGLRTAAVVALLACAMLLCGSRSAGALDPALRLSQYGHSAWRMQDGYVSGGPHLIRQSRDGYLWVGTASGLLRFDGVRFVDALPPQEHGQPAVSVMSLVASRDGSLWIGTSHGLLHLDRGRLETTAIARARVNALVERDDGSIWYARTRHAETTGPLCEVKASVVRCFGAADGIATRLADKLLEDRQGNLWIGGDVELTRWKRGDATPYFADELARHGNLFGLSALAQDATGAIWTSHAEAGHPDMLRRLQSGRWVDVPIGLAKDARFDTSALLFDTDDALWIGTTSDGIYRWSRDRLDHFGSADGLSSDRIIDLFEDREGTLWVTTSKGIDSFRRLAVTTFSSHEGLSGDEATVAFASGNDVWIGNGARVDLIHSESFAIEPAAKPLKGQQVTAMSRGRPGQIWIGLDDGLQDCGVARCRPVTNRDGSPLGAIEHMATDAAGDLWIGVMGNPARVLRLHTGLVVEELASPVVPRASTLLSATEGGVWISGGRDRRLVRRTPGNALDYGATTDIAESPPRNGWVEGADLVWFASAAGLVARKGPAMRHLDTANGLPCNDIFDVIGDQSGTLWAYASCGVLAIDAGERARWWADPAARLRVRVLDNFDGAQPAATDFSPNSTMTDDGRLWFANGTTVQMVAPTTAFSSAAFPPLHIEALHADGIDYVLDQQTRLPAGTREVQIDYTAPTSSMPRKLRFRTRLEGYQTDWENVGLRRQAFYGNLQPGAYRFQFSAGNGDGEWHESDRTLAFEVLPAWWQTPLFRIGAVLAAACVVFLFYRWRLMRVAGLERGRIEIRVAERERIAREIHDTLLQSINALILHVARIANSLPANAIERRELGDVMTDAEAALDEGRERVHQVRSLAPLRIDLGAEFAALCEDLTRTYGVPVASSREGTAIELRPMVRDEVFWIGREALLNACRHARATRIDLTIAFGRRGVSLICRDDGIGFDAGVGMDGDCAMHFGLNGMRERAHRIEASLTLRSSAGNGCEVCVQVPRRLAYAGRRPWLPAFRPARRSTEAEQ